MKDLSNFINESFVNESEDCFSAVNKFIKNKSKFKSFLQKQKVNILNVESYMHEMNDYIEDNMDPSYDNVDYNDVDWDDAISNFIDNHEDLEEDSDKILELYQNLFILATGFDPKNIVY